MSRQTTHEIYCRGLESICTAHPSSESKSPRKSAAFCATELKQKQGYMFSHFFPYFHFEISIK